MKFNRNNILVIFAFALVLLLILKQVYYQYEIKRFNAQTNGVIIKYERGSQGRYVLHYEYFVNNTRFVGTIGVTNNFVCDDGTKGCINKEFTVNYSEKSPQKSIIDLGKYDKFNRTVSFFNP